MKQVVIWKDLYEISFFQIISIEQELFTLMRLHHRNLIHYLAMKYQEEAGKIVVYVQESVFIRILLFLCVI